MKTGPNFVMPALIALLLLVQAASVPAQEHGSSGEQQKLREELVVVTDLGRLLGFVLRMQQEEPSLALNREQGSRLWQLTEEIGRTERLTPSRAGQLMAQLEDDILNPRQLMYTDQQFLNREQTRVPGAGAAARGTGGPGAAASDGGSAGSIATYAAGGAYNPLLDGSRQLGQDFAELRRLLQTLR